MALIRLISKIHFDRNKDRFKSLAFKNSSLSRGGGISVIKEECILERSKSICSHIRRYYHQTVGEPYIFWEIPSDALPSSSYELEEQTSTSGDECHHNIQGISDQQARGIFMAVRISDLQICQNHDHRPLTLQDCATFTD